MSNEAERASVLIVEDDEAVGTVLVALLGQHAFDALHVTSAEEALRVLEKRPFDAVISDVRMPGMDGVALLKVLGQRFPELPVVLLTAHGSVPLAVEAMKAGAVDFMLKPFDRDEISFVLQKAIARGERATGDAPANSEMIGASASMKDVRKAIAKLASSDATVLVRGETGTGKELVARALHRTGTRKNHPFVVVHCAALPEALLESELFGHEKGAYTGAKHTRVGLLEAAGEGTVFLDEVGEMPPLLQPKLLRALETREFRRVGSNQPIPLRARIVSATNRGVEGHGPSTLRLDLHFRLGGFTITLPSLAERESDIELLARHFLHAFTERERLPPLHLAPGAVEALVRHSWPGNVRELRAVISHAAIVAPDGIVGAREVALALSNQPFRKAFSDTETGSGVAISQPPATMPQARDTIPQTSGAYAINFGPSDAPSTDERTRGLLRRSSGLREIERDLIVTAYTENERNLSRASRALGIPRSTLRAKLRRYGAL
mgnify:CR=1 FL=1